MPLSLFTFSSATEHAQEVSQAAQSPVLWTRARATPSSLGVIEASVKAPERLSDGVATAQWHLPTCQTQGARRNRESGELDGVGPGADACL